MDLRPVDPDEIQALARESSLVCRQNAKLRAQLAELQAARDEDTAGFRSAMEGQPSLHELKQARESLANAEARAADLDLALATSEETVSMLQGRVATAEAERDRVSSDTTTNERLHRDAERQWNLERAGLQGEMCALSAELAALRNGSTEQEQQGKAATATAEAQREAMQEAARRQTETHAERVAALQGELHEARELLVSLQGGQSGLQGEAARLRGELARSAAEVAELREQARARPGLLAPPCLRARLPPHPPPHPPPHRTRTRAARRVAGARGAGGARGGGAGERGGAQGARGESEARDGGVARAAQGGEEGAAAGPAGRPLGARSGERGGGGGAGAADTCTRTCTRASTHAHARRA